LVGLAIALYLLTHLLASFYPSRPVAGSPESAFKAELDRRMPKFLHHLGIPGVVVATVIDGAPSRTYAYGFADREYHRRMTVDTLFSVASISKSVTAWGVLRLVEEGKLDLDAPAERYLTPWPLPPSPFSLRAVTVRRLLSHTAGVAAADDEFRDSRDPPLSSLDLLHETGPAADGSLRARLVAPAGSTFLYSAPGYTILQLIVEQETGKPFADYMQETVLRPLGMNRSSYRWDESMRPTTATPYLGNRRPGPILIPQDLAADSLFATAPDLARFVAAPLPDPRLPAGGGVLTPRSLRRLYTPSSWIPAIHIGDVGPDLPALGCFIEQNPGGPIVVTNAGHDPGWSSQFYMVPATGDGLVILTNSDRSEPAIAQIATLWTTWRGLPPVELTRAHRTLGAAADLAISLLAASATWLCIELCFGIALGARSFGAFSLAALRGSLVECLLALVAMNLWIIGRSAVAEMPTFRAIGVVTISAYTLVALARVLWPQAGVALHRRVGSATALAELSAGARV
jgi:CubicO group peptidase (beta-lactamase class C family)